MRKVLLWILLIAMVFALSGCSRGAQTEEEMIALVQEAMGETHSLELVFREDLENNVLMIFKSRGQFWYAVFEKEEDGYALRQSGQRRVREVHNGCYAESILVASGVSWYIFIVNNERCAQIQLVDELGETECIEVGGLPFVYNAKEWPERDGIDGSSGRFTFAKEDGTDLFAP